MKEKEKPTVCEGCGTQFPSRSAVFKHLKETHGVCLSKEAYDGFVEYLQMSQREKVILLYGCSIEDTKDTSVRSGEGMFTSMI